MSASKAHRTALAYFVIMRGLTAVGAVAVVKLARTLKRTTIQKRKVTAYGKIEELSELRRLP